MGCCSSIVEINIDFKEKNKIHIEEEKQKVTVEQSVEIITKTQEEKPIKIVETVQQKEIIEEFVVIKNKHVNVKINKINMAIQKVPTSFDVALGLLGIIRDVFFILIKLMHFRNINSIINLIGISGESIEWINHPHFIHARNPKPNLPKQIIRDSPLEKMNYIEINPTNIIFKVENFHEGSVFLSLLVKKMILECTIKIDLHKECRNPFLCIGISSPSQLNDAMETSVVEHGSGFYFRSFSCQVECHGTYSNGLREGGIKDGEVMMVVIDQLNNKYSKNGGKMNFFREGKKVPHTITNVPKKGVHLGFSCSGTLFTLHVITLRKLQRPLLSPSSPGDGGSGKMRCVGYDFSGKFEYFSYNHRDEDGNEITNIKEYYEEE